MPDLPTPFEMKDWRAEALAYDRFVFDFHTHGQYLPLIWWDTTHHNTTHPTFGLPSYVGDLKAFGDNHEGVNCMGALLGAAIAGIDKSKGPHNWLLDCEQYYNPVERIVLNRPLQQSGGSFWYDIWPNILFFALSDHYPGAGQMDSMMRASADRWADACDALTGPDGLANFDHTAFRFSDMKPVDNGQWREPDAAGGIGWLEYMAWVKWKDPRYLKAADLCMEFLQKRGANPFYEVLMPYGAYIAARMNGEQGRSYDVQKFGAWCFGISQSRGGWGVIVGRWGGYDCSGLVGSVDNLGGYAFIMNSFATAGALVPLVRYDHRYAHAIGKWMLNLSNAARLFYPNALPADHQSSAFWTGDPGHVIAYEGLRKEWDGKRPYATGDPVRFHWGPQTDLGLYGSSYVGLLGGIISRTNDEKILRLDCLATDYFHGPAYPTFLYYNPYPKPRRVRVEIGPRLTDIYETTTGRFLAKSVRGRRFITIPADTAFVLVLAPAGKKLTYDANRTLIGGVPVDYVRQPDRSRLTPGTTSSAR